MRSPRTASTTSARLRGPPSLAKNDTRGTCARPPPCSGRSQKSEGRQELHSNLIFLMDSIGDLALGASSLIWRSHKRNPLESVTKGFYWTSPVDIPEQGGAQFCILARRLAPGGLTSSASVTSPSYAQGTGFTSSASVTPLHPMHRAQDSRQSSFLVVTMHRAQDRANPPRPRTSILCTGQRIHEFRVVTPSILCTGHRIHKFRAGFPSYAQCTGYPCASVVAKVVRRPRSEVSERHRAGSWVWVVAKSRLEMW